MKLYTVFYQWKYQQNNFINVLIKKNNVYFSDRGRLKDLEFPKRVKPSLRTSLQLEMQPIIIRLN